MESAASNKGRKKPREEVAVADSDALRDGVASWLAKKKARDYVSVQAYIEPSADHIERLKRICALIQERVGVATTLGFGPRFLHSTGQLHKGGPNSVLVLQIVDQPADNLSVPETNYTFDALIQAQALGDFAALKQRRRRALRVNLGNDAMGGLNLLADTLRS
jgi:transaldolase/glucose-6-phosphate isomerase